MAALVLWGQLCRADTAGQARKIAEAKKDAVVSVLVVLETEESYEGRAEKQERKMAATATIIDPSGLAVTSLSEIDPGVDREMMDYMPENGPRFNYSSRVVDAKIRMSDGSEEAADVVLRDRDLDLAFVKPRKKPAAAEGFVDLSKSGAPLMLDEIVILSRLGQAAGRSLAASIERVQAVVTRPRRFYVVTGFLGQGCPAFALDGRAIGIVVVRSTPGAGRGDSPMDGDMAVVLPCETVARAAEQAKKAKAAK